MLNKSYKKSCPSPRLYPINIGIPKSGLFQSLWRGFEVPEAAELDRYLVKCGAESSGYALMAQKCFNFLELAFLHLHPWPTKHKSTTLPFTEVYPLLVDLLSILHIYKQINNKHEKTRFSTSKSRPRPTTIWFSKCDWKHFRVFGDPILMYP